MMITRSKFETIYLPDAFAVGSPKAINISDAYLATFLTKWGGASFNRGIYRLLRTDEVPTWAAVAESAFPEFAGRLIPFGLDWLGRMFALDRERSVDGALGVNLLEPGTGEVLEIPCTAESFHESELIDYREPALAESFFESWLEAAGVCPTPKQCIGYRTPLFLGGADIVPNLELTDLDVYWELTAQLLRKTKGLRVGTVIGGVRISE